MDEHIRASIQGFVKITDTVTGELLVDTHNDVLYGNMSAALAHSLIGNSNSFLGYIGFGNGGAYVGPTGTISYKPSLGGAASLIKDPTANLYNTVYVKKISNDSTAAADYDQMSRSYISAENYATNYEDIIVDVTIGYSEPPSSFVPTAIQQMSTDNSTFIGTASILPVTPNTLVFNEIGLFAGSNNLFVGGFTQTAADVDNFVRDTPNFSNIAGTQSKLMLTHVVFHPIQKAANRSLNIIYTLRIQMGQI